MAEKITLLELDIQTDQVEKDIISLKEEIKLLEAQTIKAKKEHGELSSEYIQYSSALHSAKSDLKTTESLYNKLTAAQQDNAGTLQKLEAENAKLRAEQKKLNLTTDEGIARNEEINAALNKNNEIISAYSDKLKQNKMAVGGYAEAIKNTIPAFGSATAAAKDFIATPIGAIMTSIVAVVGLLSKAFNRSEDSMNKVRKILGALTGMFNGLLKILEPVANFIADKIIVVFESLGKVADKTMGLVSKGLKLLGLDEAAKSVDNFTNSLKEASKAGQELADMEAKLQKAQRESKKIQLDYQKRAEKLRQIRDDESRSIEERIKANEALGKVLKEQANEELKIANQALSVAEKRIKLEGKTSDNLDKRAEALTKISDIQERITGQESEQLANLNSLRKEAADKQKANYDAQKAQPEKEIASRKEATDALVAAFQNEIELYKKQNQSKLDISRAWTKEEVALEEQRLKEIYDREVEELDKELFLQPERIGEINQAKLDLESKYQTNITNLRETYRAKEFERLQIDFENQQAAVEDNLFKQFEAQKAALDRNRQLEIQAAQKTGADVKLINAKYNQAELQMEKAKQAAKLALVSNFAGNVAALFGENTKLGKIAASAQTAVNTIQGAQSAYAAAQILPPPAGPIVGAANAALVIAGGVKAVKDIWATKTNLPGDTGGGGDTSIQATTGGSSSTAVTTQAVTGSVNPEIGQGIVSRTVTDTTSQIASGVEQGMNAATTRPVLVVEEVTSKQLQKQGNSTTQNL